MKGDPLLFGLRGRAVYHGVNDAAAAASKLYVAIGDFQKLPDILGNLLVVLAFRHSQNRPQMVVKVVDTPGVFLQVLVELAVILLHQLARLGVQPLLCPFLRRPPASATAARHRRLSQNKAAALMFSYV